MEQKSFPSRKRPHASLMHDGSLQSLHRGTGACPSGHRSLPCQVKGQASYFLPNMTQPILNIHNHCFEHCSLQKMIFGSFSFSGRLAGLPCCSYEPLSHSLNSDVGISCHLGPSCRMVRYPLPLSRELAPLRKIGLTSVSMEGWGKGGIHINS